MAYFSLQPKCCVLQGVQVRSEVTIYTTTTITTIINIIIIGKTVISAAAFLRGFCQIASAFHLFGFRNTARSSALRPSLPTGGEGHPSDRVTAGTAQSV
jgi:hypothetical protein